MESRKLRNRMTQRKRMQLAFKSRDREFAIADYAAAERRGCVQRRRNSRGLTPEQYATLLLADGLKRGWIQRRRNSRGPTPEQYATLLLLEKASLSR